jgi:hypothetical protein
VVTTDELPRGADNTRSKDQPDRSPNVIVGRTTLASLG